MSDLRWASVLLWLVVLAIGDNRNLEIVTHASPIWVHGQHVILLSGLIGLD